MTDQDRLAEIKAQLAAVDQNERVRSLGPNLTRVYLDWLVAEVERLRGLLGRLEWADHDPNRDTICAVCEGYRYDGGHNPGCELATELSRQ